MTAKLSRAGRATALRSELKSKQERDAAFAKANETCGKLPCGCTLDEGRCPEHAAMMKAIHKCWNAPSTSAQLMKRIWAHSDGYGEPGLVPPQGYDWSGIRDSTPEAIEKMYAVIE